VAEAWEVLPALPRGLHVAARLALSNRSSLPMVSAILSFDLQVTFSEFSRDSRS
jgi:hypothetical protein